MMFQKRLGNDEIRQRFAKKVGHWQVVYPSIDEIEILKSRATVKCLDCGQETDVDLANFIGRDFLKRGCSNCKMLKAQKEHVAAIEKKTQDLGYEIEDMKMSSSEIRLVVKHLACDHKHLIKRGVLWSRSKSDAYLCPVCLNGNVSEGLWDLREQLLASGITAREISKRCYYSEGVVAQMLRGVGNHLPYTEYEIKKVVKEMLEEVNEGDAKDE
ncbi:hypothetical protein [Lactobacillus delbrueckii]|uniref:hypothetical protein n=1 Tax=Lactobacillus delbrueckii TaxID=1584 RepID=UPI001F1D763B|nr:hypothetical protein [Lactobacillus delbrueckii]